MRTYQLFYLIVIWILACKNTTPSTSTVGESGNEELSLMRVFTKMSSYQILSANKLLAEDFEFGNRQPYIKFDFEKSTVSGQAGCNQINGKFKISGDTLKMGKIASTRMMCPAMAFEQEVLNVLNEGKFTFKKNSDQLILQSINGVLIVKGVEGN